MRRTISPLELLTYLSPNPVRIQDLACEFRITVEKIRRCLDCLKPMGIALLRTDSEAWIDRKGWRDADEMATEYYESKRNAA